MDRRKRLLLLGTDPYAGYRRTEAMTLSGNEITDSVRAAGVQGDGELAPDNSVGIWPGATNLCTNGGFETNTTGWVAWGAGAAIERRTTGAKFGSACLHVTVDDFGSRGTRNGTTLAASTVYTVSVWCNLPTGKTVRLAAYNPIVSLELGGADHSGSGSWSRVSCTFTSDAGGGDHKFFVMTQGDNDAVEWDIDGFQIETGSIATPYIETDGGTAARSAARVRVPTSNLGQAPTAGWVATRCHMDYASGTNNWGSGVFERLFSWQQDANNRVEVQHFPYSSTQHASYITRVTAGVAETQTGAAYTFAANSDQTIVGVWAATTVNVSTNGGAFASGASASAPATLPATADVGSVSGSSQHARRNLYWQAYGPGTLTDAQAAILHAMGNRPDYHALRAMGCTGVWDCREPSTLRYL